MKQELLHDITNQAILHNVMQSSQGNHVKVNVVKVLHSYNSYEQYTVLYTNM